MCWSCHPAHVRAGVSVLRVSSVAGVQGGDGWAEQCWGVVGRSEASQEQVAAGEGGLG